MEIEKFAEFSTLFKRMGISYEEYKELVKNIRILQQGKTFSINKNYYTIWKSDKKRSGCRDCDLFSYWQFARKEGKSIYPTEKVGCPFFSACASVKRKDKTSVSFVSTKQ